MGLFGGNKENYKDKKSIIIYFSRADENYFGGTMKYIEKGNTEVIAEYIRDIVGADIFKVEPQVPYSADYMQCIEEAKVRTRNRNSTYKRRCTRFIFLRCNICRFSSILGRYARRIIYCIKRIRLYWKNN